MQFATVELSASVADTGANRPPSAVPAVDFSEMRLRLADDELIAEVIEVFLVDFPIRLAQVEAAVAARDAAGIGRACHALRGAASNLAAVPVVDAASALETVAGAATIDPVAADTAWLHLVAEGERLEVALRGAAAAESHGGDR